MNDTVCRWTVVFHPTEKELDEGKALLAYEQNTAQQNEDTTQINIMNNYFGIGLDADICLEFHRAREGNPDKFNSRQEHVLYRTCERTVLLFPFCTKVFYSLFQA